ncbi:sulfotransferase family protein [Pseudoalteromonas byunsanensis]|uniref:Sulfotransferase family protein n=1 Tax=Pseudoalteromonas byunsanensis TaxID=327939 RepID=A0A1S1NA33_9GAMM|nr:sulfotransferase family protein [Pseudoalteromonas byunsanensis]OHU96538.1 sulfotransferase family protein [Pseudoalteromonas byunsanensis]
MSKVFVVGLPRTGTTSLCIACLELGFKTAHTAYTRKTFQDAEVIADTPVFNDYQRLADVYPNSRFIYLERDITNWLPSISQLLERMAANLLRCDGGFNDTIKRCFLATFSGLTQNTLRDHDFLRDCYIKHQQQAITFFKAKQLPYLLLNVAEDDALDKLKRFLNTEAADLDTMPFTNKAGKVTAWNDISHPLKISSTRNGKVDKDATLY